MEMSFQYQKLKNNVIIFTLQNKYSLHIEHIFSIYNYNQVKKILFYTDILVSGPTSIYGCISIPP